MSSRKVGPHELSGSGAQGIRSSLSSVSNQSKQGYSGQKDNSATSIKGSQVNSSSYNSPQLYSNFGNGATSFHSSQVSRNSTYVSSRPQNDQKSVKNFYKGLGSLPEDRLSAIARDFLKLYGSNGELNKSNLAEIQKIAHSQTSTQFEQQNEDVESLGKVMDLNRDGRILEDDVVRLCRKYLNCQKKPITYTSTVEERLSVARRLFNQFDVEKKGFLTERQVPNLLSETYRTLGRDFKATEEDIRSWMRLTDGDNDGHVTLLEYERSIIRALKKQGIKIYED